MANNNKSGNGRRSISPLVATADGMSVRPNKLRGQNFLINSEVIDRIVEQGRLTGTEKIVEIGPGLGALTSRLKDHASSVTAIEIEDDFVLYLKAAFINEPRIQIISADAACFDYTSLYEGEEFIIYGNLPYSITSRLVEKLLLDGGKWTRMVLLLQKEAAQRIAYGKGRDNGPLSILASYMGHCEVVFDVLGACFDPPPAVNSAVLTIERYKEAPVNTSLIKLMAMANAAFSNRRKTLVNCLAASAYGGNQDYWRKALTACGLNISCRAEELQMADFDRLIKWNDEHPAL